MGPMTPNRNGQELAEEQVQERLHWSIFFFADLEVIVMYWHPSSTSINPYFQFHNFHLHIFYLHIWSVIEPTHTQKKKINILSDI